MEFLKRAIEQIRQMWGNLTSGQRVLVSAIAVAIVLLTVWGATVSTTENWVRVVGHEVSDDVRGQIITQFNDENQKYDLQNMEIHVPRKDAQRVALQLASRGIMTGDAIWKFLDEPSIIASRWDKEKRYQRAIQLTLEAMIRTLKPVRNARVLLNPGSERARLGFVGDKPSASVQVELHPGETLSRKNVKAIAGGVAGSIAGLSMNGVHIIDTEGRPYRAREESDLATPIGIRELEMQYEEQVKREVEEFFPGSVTIIRVVVESKREHVEDVKVSPGVPINEETRKFKDKGQISRGVGGIKGESFLTSVQEGAIMKNDKDESEERTQSAVSTIKRITDDPGGQIVKVSAAVKWPVPADENGQLDTAYVTENEPKVKRAVQLALGPIATEEDVTIFPFPMSAPEPLPPTPLMDRILEGIHAHWAKVALLLMALFGLILVYKIIKAAMPTDMVQEIQAIRTRIDEEGRVAGEAMAPAADEGARAKQGIKDLVAKNPAGGGLVLNRWMGSK